MYQLTEFRGIIKSLSYKFPSKDVQDKYEVEQSLYAKLCFIWPLVQDLPRNEVFKFVKTTLNNHTIDIIRKSKTQSKFNVTLKFGGENSSGSQDSSELGDDYDLEDAVIYSLESNFGSKLDQFMYSDTTENMLLYKDLKSHLIEWSKSQDEKTKQFIEEFVCPSEETMEIWSYMVDKNPVYKTYDWIPAYAYTKIIGISRSKIYRIMKKMREYLLELGYGHECYGY